MFFCIAHFLVLSICFLHGLAKSASDELLQTLKAPVVEQTVENGGDSRAGQQVVEVDDIVWWKSDGEQHANHKTKTKPTVRDSHFTTKSNLQIEDWYLSESIIGEKNWDSVSNDIEIVLTNELSIDMQDEEEIIDVEYRYNIFPETWVKSEDLRRRANEQIWEPIRILPWFSLSNQNDQSAEYLMHVVKAGIAYLEKLMNVERVVGKLKLTGWANCGESVIPSSHRNTGVDADVVIYITANKNTEWCALGAIAYAGVCKRDYSKRRPIAGYVNYCKVSSEKRRTKWRSDVEIAVHELSHVLFWLKSSFKRWRDEKGKERGLHNVLKCKTIQGEERCYIVTPNVRRVVQDHFNCKSAYGLELEHQGEKGTKNQHLDAKLYQEDIMTGVADSTMRVYSIFNIAMMHDSGWYNPNYGREGRIT